MASWEVSSEREPPDIGRADLVAIEASLTPASDGEMLRAVAEVMANYPPPPNPAIHTASCRALLRSVPLDLLHAGLLRVLAECTFTPVPAEIWKRVEPLLLERERLVIKARVAADKAARRKTEPPPRPPTEEELRRVSEMVASVKVTQRGNPLKECGPDRQPVEPSVALRKVAEQRGTFRLPDESDPAVQQWLRTA